MTTLFRNAALAFVLSVLFVAQSAVAAEPVSKSRFGGLAIGGHDTVAYHQLERDPQDKAIKGKKSFIVTYKGAKWRFASEEDSKLFEADPERYSPAYNGHCANALSLGNGLVKTNGTHWEIHEDKLYLFYAAGGRDRWNDGNWQTYKVDADKAWEKLSK